MTHQSMSELVVGLEAAGFVQRVPDPADGRAKLICLTPLGRRVVRKAVEEIANNRGGMVSTKCAASLDLMNSAPCCSAWSATKGAAAATAERRAINGSVTSNRSSRLGRR
jgi:DNA-binding MarR family transcriptional regulator